MKIPNRKHEFQAFKDGICDIYAEDEEGQKTYKYTGLNFDKRVLGFNRHYAAKAVQVQTDMIIRIPLVSNINNYDLLTIKGIGKFSIEFVQDKYECNPPSLDLTLRQLEVHE